MYSLALFKALLIWVCVVGVEGPQWWDHPHLTEADEKVYSGIGLALALFPVCLCPVATLAVLYSNRKVYQYIGL